MRLIATLLALIVSYLTGAIVAASIVRNSSSGLGYLLSLLVAAFVAAVVYTAMKDGPRSLLGIIRRR